MPDLLVPLYSLPRKLHLTGFSVRRPMAHEGGTTRNWIEAHFSKGWASEVLPAICRTPSTMIIALEKSTGKLAGFCVWDCTALGFLGPVGVAKEYRGTGVGRAVTLEVLHCMREQGYGYGIVGGAGPVDFFQSVCGATVIPKSIPGIYPEPIK
ncbi:MAG: GNAT family N-acetyltransferase [Candidatus Sabulitectum sp.]|nr:GNAT family N-acetyltransferase [Candidatus Sabulitectum sp.]